MCGLSGAELSAGPLSQATRPASSHPLFDRVAIPVASPPTLTAEEMRAQAEWWLTFFWAMAPIAVKYTARGEIVKAAAQVDLLTQAYTDIWTLMDPSDTSGTADIPRLGRTISPRHVIHVVTTLCAAMERLHSAIESAGVDVPTEMPGEVMRQVAMADVAIGVGR